MKKTAIILSWLAVVLCAPCLYAGLVGVVYGTVTNSWTGLPINGATVTSDVGAQEIKKLIFGGGGYLINAPPDAGYILRAEADGYCPAEYTSVAVAPDQFKYIPFKLEPLIPVVDSVNPKRLTMMMGAEPEKTTQAVTLNGSHLDRTSALVLIDSETGDESTNPRLILAEKAGNAIKCHIQSLSGLKLPAASGRELQSTGEGKKFFPPDRRPRKGSLRGMLQRSD
jgi:hypothetical protein